MAQIETLMSTNVQCYHCGDDCPDVHPTWENKDFCCQGCKVVCELLSTNGMIEFYAFQDRPGISRREVAHKAYDFLEEDRVIEKLLEFREGNTAKISFMLPQIHCSSCIWLLENINKLHSGIVNSRVNFLQKKATITFRIDQISLKELAQLLSSIGYDPELNLEKLHEDKKFSPNRSLFYKMGLAGFAFGNIMLLSFPEYLGFVQQDISRYIGFINIGLSIPVLLYSAADYLKAAYWTVKFKKITIDIPIATGILTLFLRSVFDIVTGTGEGYLDSLAGFIFFMLIGKWFQNYTFQSISFDRNYRSYFPISAWVFIDGIWKTTSLETIQPGDTIMIKNEEIVPADGVITRGEGNLDYSFVTGESESIHKKSGDKVFAGARHAGSSFEMQAIKKVNQSYLTSLWDEHGMLSENRAQTEKLIAVVGKYFTIAVMSIALLTLIFWLFTDSGKAYNSFTAVLIVACPCALSLALPFTYGNVLRLLGKAQCYLKNTDVIEQIQSVNHVVFDKTGTITDHEKMEMVWHGPVLSTKDKFLIKSLVFQSNHPVSRSIFQEIDGNFQKSINHFTETIGQGITGEAEGHNIKIGSEKFVINKVRGDITKGVFIQIDDQLIGYYSIQNRLRNGVGELFNKLSEKTEISILSGDNDGEESRLRLLFPQVKAMLFNQNPKDKMAYIRELQHAGKKVMMIGDGLNDAGALQQSNAGIVISSNSNNFTPACDGIIHGSVFPEMVSILGYIQQSRWLIYGAFSLALLYNIIGLAFAVQGLLSPVIAAILMPISSISVMLFGVLSSRFMFQRFLKNQINKK